MKRILSVYCIKDKFQFFKAFLTLFKHKNIYAI